MTDLFDVAIIGAGLVGSAVARELGAFDLSVALIDACGDVGDGTSKANTAILHTGFDATPGTTESRLVRRGYELLGKYAEQTGIPVERTGALLVAWTEEELAALPKLRRKASANGYDECAPLGLDEVYTQVPALGPGALGGLFVPGESITCTWTANLALATEARQRGVELYLRQPVAGIAREDGVTTLLCETGRLRARWVVNAAGLGSDQVDGMFGLRRFTVTPRRGELLVFDKLARPLVDRIILPVPTKVGKGVLVSPTIYGNVMLGPTAEDLNDRTATATSRAGLEFLLAKGRQIMPRLLGEEVTATYAGLRAAIDSSDYLIDADAQLRYVLIGGIRSTGLTASMAIAEQVVQMLRESGLEAKARTNLPDPPMMPNIGESFLRPYQDNERIHSDPEYGRIVCFCERVTAGEVRDAFSSPIPPSDLDGLRRRTRAMNGRCQGFYCGAHLGSVVGRMVGSRSDR